MILSQDFYLQPPMDAARALVGAYLCRQMPDGAIIRARICELELYLEMIVHAMRLVDAAACVMTQCLWWAGTHTCICVMDCIIC